MKTIVVLLHMALSMETGFNLLSADLQPNNTVFQFEMSKPKSPFYSMSPKLVIEVNNSQSELSVHQNFQYLGCYICGVPHSYLCIVEFDAWKHKCEGCDAYNCSSACAGYKYFSLRQNGFCGCSDHYSMMDWDYQVNDYECGYGPLPKGKPDEYDHYAVYSMRGWLQPDYIGCYVDDAFRDLNSGPKKCCYSVAMCQQACWGYKYFSLQDEGWCFCGNSYGTRPQYRKVPREDCYKTGGFASYIQPLGARRRNAVYRTQSLGKSYAYQVNYISAGACREGSFEIGSSEGKSLFETVDLAFRNPDCGNWLMFAWSDLWGAHCSYKGRNCTGDGNRNWLVYKYDTKFKCKNVKLSNFTVGPETYNSIRNARVTANGQVSVGINNCQSSLPASTAITFQSSETKSQSRSYSFTKSLSKEFTTSMQASVTVTAEFGIELGPLKAGGKVETSLSVGASFTQKWASESTKSEEISSQTTNATSININYNCDKFTNCEISATQLVGKINLPWTATATCDADAGGVSQSRSVTGTFEGVSVSKFKTGNVVKPC